MMKNSNSFNIKTKKYSIYSMDIVNLRFELSSVILHLRLGIFRIIANGDDIINHYNEIKYIKLINNFYISMKKLYEFTNKYNYNDLIKINYKEVKDIDKFKNNLTKQEIDFINLYYNGKIERYSKELEFFNYHIIEDYEYRINELKTKKFYANENYILTEQEQLSSLILTFITEGEIYINDRENFGYVIKTILNEYDYNLIRNVLYVFYDDLDYNDFIRGKRKMIETFDEDLFCEVTKIVTNPHYMYSNDSRKTEEFEKKYKSKYNEIQELIKINNL